MSSGIADSVRERRTIRAAEAGRHDGNLDVALLWSMYGTGLETKVFWSVEDGGVLEARHVGAGLEAGGCGDGKRVFRRSDF